jgi:mono/diheme cytochrome c family protein
VNDTIFYVLGIGLVLSALVVAFVGIRFERFPGSKGLQTAAMLLFAVLVVSTAIFAWRNASDEQDKRQTELAAAEQESIKQGDTGDAAEQGATTATTTTAATVDGAQVFADQQCGGCHTLSAAGTTGTIGPVLDSGLKGKTSEFIRTSIVDPNADITTGFPPDTMPGTYGDILSPEELDGLVKYLFESTNPKG